MSRLVTRRARVSRVRDAQHRLAMVESLRAQQEADSIAHNAQRLARVRGELFQAPPLASGASFAAYRELADRLERAGLQLEGALYDAHKRVEIAQGQQIDASRDKEIAQRLQQRARADADAKREARIAALPRYRSMQNKGTDQ